MSSIHFTQDDIELIRRDGELNFPDECCGFMFGSSAGDQRDVREVQPIGNEQDENRARRFLISPEQFKKAEKYAREKNLELIGFYHTHPNHPAIPSQFDRDHALPFYSYTILSVRDGVSAELRSWQLELERTGYVEEQVLVGATLRGRPQITEITK